MQISKNDVCEIIKRQARESALNHFAAIGLNDEPMWQEPIIGFSRGDDPYFDFLKDDIGSFHWSPAEVFRLGGKGNEKKSGELCVISIGFPQTVTTKELQTESKKEPTLRWTVSRGEWEKMIYDITKKIVEEIEEKGTPAVSLDHIKEFRRETSKKYGIASLWSHRHTAFICGLGTFGHSDGLITRKGKAMRFTTLILASDIDADARWYEEYNEWCMFSKGCRDCMNRCPVGAITEEGHNKEKCSNFLGFLKDKALKEGKLDPDYISGCGLCQCGVACQDGLPGLK